MLRGCEWKSILASAIVCAGTCWVLSGCGPPLFRKSVTEKLDNPKKIVGRDGATLILEDGTRATLPGVDGLESNTPFLDVACNYGVETTKGRPVGLIQIHHWCGNDPVGKEIARVDLGDLVLWAGEAKGPGARPNGPASFRYSEFGWNASQYSAFRRWQESRNH